MIIRFIYILISAFFLGGATYVACAIWPLEMDSPTALIAAFSVTMGWALVAGVFADSKQDASDD